MWIFIKLLVTTIAFVIRFFGKHFQRQNEFNLEAQGIKYLIKKYLNIKKYLLLKTNISSTVIKFPFACGSVFKITEEGSLDRFFKTLSGDKFNELRGAENVEFKIGQGYLRCPWIRGIYRTDF